MANGNIQDKNIAQLLYGLINKATTAAGKFKDLPFDVGVATGQATGKAVPGKEEEGKKVLKQVMEQLNPLQENVLKSVQKVHKQQTEEAMAMGASGEQVLKDAGISIAPEQPTDEEGQPTETSLALAGVQPPELTGQQAQGSNQVVDLLNNIVSLGGFIKPSPQSRLATAQAETLEQALRGETPLQAGDLQKLILQETIKADKEGLLKPQDLFSQFEKASQVFVTTRDAQARIEASFTNPSPAGDLSMLFNYMKILDPGSVVRESEFRAAGQAGSLPQKIQAGFNRAINGKLLAPAQRKDFINRARKLFGAIERQQGKTVKEFQRLGRKSGIDPEVFIRDVGLVQQQTQPGTRQMSGQTKSGNTFRRTQ